MGKVRVNGEEIFYREKGGAPPLILFIHGAGGNGTLWLPVLNRIKKKMWRIAIDLPEHGLSGGKGRNNIEEYADIVEKFVALLGNPEVIIAGHSMGGAVALTVALRKYPWLKGLVLVATGAKLKVAPFVFDAIASFSEETVKIFAQILIPSEGENRNLIEKSLREIKKEVIAGDFIACDKFNAMDRVKEIKVPTLIICGTNDMLTPQKYSEYLQREMENSHLVIIEGAGHMLPVEKSKEVAEEIEKFVMNLRK